MGNQSTQDLAKGRLQSAVQLTRARAFLFIYFVGLCGVLSGVFDIDLPRVHGLFLVGIGSVIALQLIYRYGLDDRWGVDFTPFWMGLDVLLVTGVIYVVGAPGSVWLVWYLSNTAAAAFVGGRRAALWVAAANSVCYLLLLVFLGEIRAMDHGFFAAIFQLTVLYGASFHFLRGIADLRRRQAEVRDLVEEKNRRLEEVSRLNEVLEDRTQELAAATLQSQEASRAKSQFLANMSHELRTPLNSIIGFSEILSEKVSEQLDVRYRKFLTNILQSGRHLLGLINDILDLSKIEAGKMELSLQKVSLATLMQGVCSVMVGMAGRRSIQLQTDIAQDLPIVIVDGPKVKQILYNLISNAIKFSSDNSIVEIGAKRLAIENSPIREEAVSIWVTDHGIGIQPQDLACIFEEFRQLDDNSTRIYSGTGLGLTLVKCFTEMQGGRVSVQSMPGAGSTFEVVLPVNVSRLMKASTGEKETKSNLSLPIVARDRPLVLIIEDDELFYEALATDLEAAGYATRHAVNGEEALDWLRKEKPAIVTLDLALPGVDGWAVLKALKEDPTTADIPVIIVSLVKNHELGFALGAEDYFLKPLERRRFLKRLEEITRNSDPAHQDENLVLIIDDDSDVQAMLQAELEEGGYGWIGARDGRSGVALAIEKQPAIIVLDLMMPEMSGFEVAAALKENPRTEQIPILVLTAKEVTDEDRRQLAGHIEGLIPKGPLDRRKILQTIRSIEGRLVKPSVKPQE